MRSLILFLIVLGGGLVAYSLWMRHKAEPAEPAVVRPIDVFAEKCRQALLRQLGETKADFSNLQDAEIKGTAGGTPNTGYSWGGFGEATLGHFNFFCTQQAHEQTVTANLVR